MPKQFTRGLLLAIAVCVGACSSVPQDGDGPIEEVAHSQTAALDEPTPHADGLLAQQVDSAAPVPLLRDGNQALFERAKQLVRSENDTAAEVLFLELTQSQPELAGPWVNLGHIAARRGDDEEARLYLEQALQANPNSCEALNKLAVLSRRHGLFGEAEAHYRRCLETRPFYAAAHLNLGILYELYMGRLADALVAYHEYQNLVAEPDLKVAGWVMDLERRVASIAKR